MYRLKNITGKELAGLWGLSAKTAARQFTDEAGVMRVANERSATRLVHTRRRQREAAVAGWRAGGRSLAATRG